MPEIVSSPTYLSLPELIDYLASAAPDAWSGVAFAQYEIRRALSSTPLPALKGRR